MANYANLLATIAANVYQNTSNAVTADMVKTALNSMVASLGAGYQCLGVADLSTPAITPDYKCFYIVSTPGTYANFNNLVVNDGEVCLFKWDSAWSKEVTGAATSAVTAQLSQDVSDLRQDTAGLDTRLDTIEDALDFQEVRLDELPDAFVIPGTADNPGSYLSASGKIVETQSGRYLTAYPVAAAQKVKFYGDQGSAVNLGACGFTSTAPACGVEGVTVIATIDGTIDMTYTCPSAGWVLCYTRDADRFCKAYAVGLVSREDGVNSLRDKTIAILGDSIMQLMGGGVFHDNIVTFKNITDTSDTNIYQSTDVSVVRGIMYLSSTLVDGVPDENSERVEIVNSKQSEIDSRGWDSLKELLGAHKVINCAMGGGRITEMGVVTAYPSRSSGIPYEGDIESLPNQVKMLIRLVGSGTYDAPDCIVIWMGVNGTTNYINNMSLDEAMAIPWATLSDDVAGYYDRRAFFGALRYSIEALYRAFPYATICVVSPVQTAYGDESYSSTDAQYRGYANLKDTKDNMQSVAERYACLFFNALNEIGVANFSYKATESSGLSTGERLGNLIPEFTRDGLHPNANGNIVWRNYLYSKLRAAYFSKQD